MRRLMTVLGAMAVVGLTLGTACADLVGFQLGMNEFNLDNTNYPTGNNGAAFQAGGWTATTEGALWIKTGSGSPVLNTQDLNFELDYRATPTSAWITITNTYLLSNGVAEYDCSYDYYSYPGQFEGVDNTFGVPADHASPYRYLYAGSAEYVLPGTGPTGQYPDGQPTQPGMQFDLYAWTGTFNSYAAAVAGGADAAVSGPFQVGPTSFGINPGDDAFYNMPSMVLQVQPTPEPSTVFLAVTGLVGMSAYAWRKCRRR